MDAYLLSRTKEDLKKIVEDLSLVCEKANVSTLLEFKESSRKILDFINASKILDETSRKMVFDLLNVYIKAIGNSIYKDLMEFMKRFKVEIK